MARGRRTDAELQHASGHVLYGLTQLVGAADRLALGVTDQVTHNALIESFASHVRSLMEFFDSRPDAKADDVIAADFFDDSATWTSTRPVWPTDLDGVRERVNKELAHLTY
jgi:hypothetical protein